jgi:DMSO reductase anchor subunit
MPVTISIIEGLGSPPSGSPRTAPVELIPARRQTLWGVPAVVNFALGGTGAGLYVAAAIAARLGSSPSLGIASWLGPALVLAGFVAVATEAGRPLRGARVLTRVATSWMSRELVLGGLFVIFAAGEFVAPSAGQRLAATVAAVALGLAQGFILRQARGVTAWSVPPMPLVLLQSALVGGAGLMVVIDVMLRVPPGGAVMPVIVTLLPAAAIVWLAFVTWSDGAFAEATRPLRQGGAAVAIFGAGYVAPFALFAFALGLGDDTVAPALGGLLMVGAQAYAKAVLILRCGQLRPITVPHLRLARRSS